MPRGGKKKLQTMRIVKFEKGRVEAPLLFDPNDLTFRAEFGGETFANESAAVVERWLTNKLKQSVDITWQAVIEIREADKNWNPTVFVGFHLDRYYIGRRPSTGYAKIEWPLAKDYETIRWISFSHDFYWKGEFSVPFVKSEYGRNTYYLPYTEETWAAIQELIEGINRLKVRLREILGTEEGRLTLSTVGKQLLAMLPSGLEDE